MQDPNPLWETLSQFIQDLHQHKGKTIQVDEAITLNPGNYNRHFTSYTRFTLVLQNVGIRTSGARLMIHGNQEGYEIATTGILQTLQPLENNTWELIEHLSDQVHRRTFIKVLN